MFYLFYAIACHFLVRGEREGERGDFKKKMTKFNMVRGGREFQKNAILREGYTFWMVPICKFWKKSLYVWSANGNME